MMRPMVSLIPPRRSLTSHRWPIGANHAADLAAVLALFLLTAIATGDIVVGDTMVGQDTAAFFYPIFRALGQRLAAGDIPGWNPHQFAGVPFAADPESGWMYLPAMLFFTALPVATAAKAWLIFHLVLPGLVTYGLGRVLGLGVLGSLTAAVAYEFSGLLYARNVCCPAYGQVLAWLPALLLGTEMAIRSRTWSARLAWWGAAGLALSQILVAWLGQGSYYALLAFGGYVLYRTVFSPPHPSGSFAKRLLGLALHGAVPLTIGLALAAAAILPRFEYHTRSNLAEGYTGDLAWAAVLGGWDGSATITRLLGPTLFYVGGSTLVLVGAALVLARGHHAVPYFTALAVGALVLAQAETTPLHRLPYILLPRFEELHRHWPERVMVVFYLGPAMLAGVAVNAIAGRRHLMPRAGVAVLAVLVPTAMAVSIRWGIPQALVAGSVALLAIAAVRGGTAGRLVPPLLILTVFVDLFVMGRFNLDHGPFGGFHEVDLGEEYTPSGAATFLRERAEDGDLGRFFGYDPGIHPGDTTPQLYRFSFADPRANVLLLNNRATALGLQDIQGYNPIQPQRYVEVMRALNGFAQEYHEANVYSEGLGSPLLDLLNTRYILVPAAIPADRTDLRGLIAAHPVVYRDEDVQILENRAALPRAWLVHEARLVAPGEALPLLASGAVDPRRVALLEDAPSQAIGPPGTAGDDEVSITAYEADHLTITVRTAAPALLVLSETADPAWRAEVDGEPVSVLTANHVLRAVPVPAGQHTVELRYESSPLRAGLAVSLLGYVGLIAIWAAAGWKTRHAVRQRRRTR